MRAYLSYYVSKLVLKNDHFKFLFVVNQLIDFFLSIQNSNPSKPQISTLQIGTHNYFGETINTVPIKTTTGLCYKVQPLKLEFNSYIMFFISGIGKENLVDKINLINLYVATNNTWQGLIYGVWPKHTKNPLKIVGEISQSSVNQYIAPLEIADWSYLEGNDNYSECLRDNEITDTGCKSMFHPSSYKLDNR